MDHVLAKASDLPRGRYLPLAADVVRAADEIWLVPGKLADGRVRFRRRYLKAYEGERGEAPVMVLAGYQRRVWEGFNLIPLGERSVDRTRIGVLIWRRQAE